MLGKTANNSGKLRSTFLPMMVGAFVLLTGVLAAHSDGSNQTRLIVVHGDGRALPLANTRRATNRDPVYRSGWLTDEITLSWLVRGVEVIAVTAENDFGMEIETPTVAI